MAEAYTPSSGDFACDHYVIVPHPTEPKLLLNQDGDAWTLPHFVLKETLISVVSHVNRAVRQGLGLDVTVLCCLLNQRLRGADRATRVYIVENHSPQWRSPPDSRWIGSEELKATQLAVPQHYTLLEDWFHERSGGTVPPLRVPWARSGWFEQASAWIYEQLDRLEYVVTGPVEQLRAWVVSCVMRVETTGGRIYFKASPLMFAREPVLTHYLSQRFPENLPTILAMDAERHWMLMADLGSRTFRQLVDVASWEEALRLLARIQIDHVERIHGLLALGLPDRRLDTLVQQIDPLFEDADAMLVGHPNVLSEAEVKALRSLAPRLKDMCAELVSFDIPETLEHGDLDSGNAFVRDGQFVYMDWSDSSVAHPFFTMTNFWGIPDAGSRLRDAYLEPWTAYEPMERLVRAYRLAQPLSGLHQALDYHRYIMPYLEPGARWELETYLPGILRSRLLPLTV